MYPYKLDRNPYPSSPTPTLIDAKILGGKRHKEAKAAMLSCISDLYSKVSAGTATDKDFRLVTVIQDVGSGKTHLALHTKGLKEVSDSTVVSYVDLSQISPRNMHSLYSAMLAGFTDDYSTRLRQAVVNYLREKAERNISRAKKIFNYGFTDALTGKTLEDKAAQLLRNEIVPNYAAITDTLGKEFSLVEIAILKLVIEGKFRADAQNVATLEDIIASLAALANLNLKFLHRLTGFQIDEFDSDKESVEFVKAVINAHLPATTLMLIFTPSSYEDIRRSNASVFDRMEKANYKIDIAGSNTLEEIMDIVLEYISGGGKRQREIIRQGDVFLLAANTPHSPQRPANSVGLVVERVRGSDEPEAYAWYCERCDEKLYELSRGESDLLEDLRNVNLQFNASASLRTCKACGYVQPVPTGPRL